MLAAGQPGRTRSWRQGVHKGLVSAARLLITSHLLFIRWRGVILTVGEAKPGIMGRSSSRRANAYRVHVALPPLGRASVNWPGSVRLANRMLRVGELSLI